jgi:DNA-binding MarR family transcriptional regulator
LFRLLVAVYDARPKGIATYDLLHKLGSTHHSKAFIKRAEKEGLIKRKAGEPSATGQFAPVYNFITPKGTELLKNSLNIK